MISNKVFTGIASLPSSVELISILIKLFDSGPIIFKQKLLNPEK